jgi:hypothetical protein
MHWFLWVSAISLYVCGAAALLRIILTRQIKFLTACGLLVPVLASWFLMAFGQLVLTDSSRPRDGAVAILAGVLVLPMLASSFVLIRRNPKASFVSFVGWAGLSLVIWTCVLSDEWTSFSRVAGCALNNACDCPEKGNCGDTQANDALNLTADRQAAVAIR